MVRPSIAKRVDAVINVMPTKPGLVTVRVAAGGEERRVQFVASKPANHSWAGLVAAGTTMLGVLSIEVAWRKRRERRRDHEQS
jgi:hypothetical protein